MTGTWLLVFRFLIYYYLEPPSQGTHGNTVTLSPPEARHEWGKKRGLREHERLSKSRLEPFRQSSFSVVFKILRNRKNESRGL